MITMGCIQLDLSSMQPSSHSDSIVFFENDSFMIFKCLMMINKPMARDEFNRGGHHVD